MHAQLFGVDSFGNDIIDQFLKIEKTRHSAEKREQYKEKIELTQFVKVKECQENKELVVNVIDWDKDIFSKELYPIIVLIGKEENIMSRQIKEEYEEQCIIEIYTQDIEADNFKFITKDISPIINLLRVIAYTNDIQNERIPWNYNGLAATREILCNDNGKKNIEIYQYEGTAQEVAKEIATIPKNFLDENCIIQIIGNEKLDEYLCLSLVNKLYKKRLLLGNIGHMASHICEIENIEVIIMKIK